MTCPPLTAYQIVCMDFGSFAYVTRFDGGDGIRKNFSICRTTVYDLQNKNGARYQSLFDPVSLVRSLGT